MTSERIRTHVERLLDEADAALLNFDWARVLQNAEAALRLDPNNVDAVALLVAANRDPANVVSPSAVAPQTQSAATPERESQPTSFANGRYTVTKFLGEGGKKKVYLARDSRLDRDVAFALIKTEGLDEASRVRVQREAEAMGRLGAHPHIVTVFDIGEENGQPYLVLPVLAGGDVEGVIEKAPENKLTIERAVKIALDTCLGLEFAHSKGIVHRDLKPGNVWLTEDGRAMIGDFGLAVATDRSRLTQAGMMVGTVSYMPPEQAMGGEVGPRSDLYSLGAMLYEMVCGRPPFVGDESVAIIGQHLNTPPVAPTWHRPDCPTSLEALILRLLEKDPSKRPTSATEVREALEGVTSARQSGYIEIGQRTTTEPAPSGDNPLYRRTFVGREAELKQVQSAFDAALSGQGGLVMVVGEPGIGKTALCEQLATYVALRGGKALVGHCYEEGSLSLPYLAFVEAMRSYVLAREPDGLRSDLGTGAADVARIVSEVRERVQGVELRQAGDPEDDRWRLLQAVTSFLRNASTVQPLCIVLEDLHWADRGTLDLLLQVSRNLQGARLLIVGTYRDVEVDRSHPLSSALAEIGRAASFQRVRLRGLTADEVQRMMAGVAQRDIPWPLAELLHRQTEGSPLFVQEMLRYLVEEGLVAEREGSLRRVGDDTLVGRIPEGLRDVIGKRLTRLGPDANRLLAIASVIGRDFRLDVLERVAAMAEDDLIAALEEAKSAAVVEERASAGAVVTYRFSHAFFSQTLYEEISAPRRIRLHQQVGSALEEVFARRLDEHAPELAEHFSHSSDAADLTKAVHYGELAAQRAMSVFDYGEAARLLERAIEVQEVLDPDDKARRCDLLLALADALLPAGQFQRIIDQLTGPAAAIAMELGDAGRTARACQIALLAIRTSGGVGSWRTEVARHWAKLAIEYSAPDSEARVHTDLVLADQTYLDFGIGKGRELHRRALALARQLGNSETISYAASAMLGHAMNDPREHRALADEFVGAPLAGVSRRTRATLLWFCGQQLLAAGELERAAHLLDQVTVLSVETRDATLATLPLQASLSFAQVGGKFDEVLELADQVRRLGTEVGRPGFGNVIADRWSWSARISLGQIEEAWSVISKSSGPAFDTDTAGDVFRAITLGLLGRRDEAKRIIQDALPGDMIPFREMLCLEAAIIVGDLGAQANLVERVSPYVGYFLPSSQYRCPERLLGEASLSLNRLIDARKYYEEALRSCSKMRNRPELALTRLDLAELLLEHYPDERAAAIEHLDFAIAELRDMKMQPALERALRHRGLLKA